MDKEKLEQIAKKYNETRSSFNFYTTSVKDSATIASLYETFPELNKLEGDELLRGIGLAINRLMFE